MEIFKMSDKIINISELLPIWQISNYRCTSCRKKWVSVHIKGFKFVKCNYCSSKNIFYIQVTNNER